MSPKSRADQQKGPNIIQSSDADHSQIIWRDADVDHGQVIGGMQLNYVLAPLPKTVPQLRISGYTPGNQRLLPAVNKHKKT